MFLRTFFRGDNFKFFLFSKLRFLFSSSGRVTSLIIRSFLSKNRRLFYQAGAGIVFKSNPDSENQEVYNKIEALRKSIKIAESI